MAVIFLGNDHKNTGRHLMKSFQSKYTSSINYDSTHHKQVNYKSIAEEHVDRITRDIF